MARPWERVPNICGYYVRLARRILSDSSPPGWGHVVGAAIGIATALLSREVGWIPRGSIPWTILVAAIPYAAVVIFMVIFNAIRAPVKLDNGVRLHARRVRESARRTAAAQRSRIQGLNQRLARPERTPGEEHRFEIVRQALDEHGAQAGVVLRHLLIHGKLVFQSNAVQASLWATSPLPSGMTTDQTHRMLNLLIRSVVTYNQRQIRAGSEHIYEIAPGMLLAVEALVHPAKSSETSQT